MPSKRVTAVTIQALWISLQLNTDSMVESLEVTCCCALVVMDQYALKCS